MVNKREGIVTNDGKPMTLLGEEIKVGDRAPNFTALKTDFSQYSLEDAGNKVKIISVVPSLDTEVCSLQTIRFNKEQADLEDAVILTISADLPVAQKRFCETQGVNRILTLSDYRDLDFGMKYGFVLEEMRLLSRGIVVLDRDNTVRYVEYVNEIGNHPDYDKALEEAKKLI